MYSLADVIGLTVNTIALFLLVIGVVRRKGSKKVLIRHGYLSILGFAMKMATVFAVMLPTLLTPPLNIQGLTVLQLAIVATKVTLGIAGTVMGFICIVPWFFKPVEQMACSKVKQWMLPTFIIWALSVIFGGVASFLVL